MIFKNTGLDNRIHWAGFFAKTTKDTLNNVELVIGSAEGDMLVASSGGSEINAGAGKFQA